MMNYIFDVLAVIGIVWVVSYSKLFKPFREAVTKKSLKLGQLINCWGCLSFWISILYIVAPCREYTKFVFSSIVIAVVIQKYIDEN